MIKNFAHRGFSGKYPENTMLAFAKAIEVGADGIELDVHLSSDGEVVIIHDEQLTRTTDGTGFVGSYTYKELSLLNASKTHPEISEKQKIPTLREYLDLVKDTDLLTNIELKTGIFTYPGIEEKTLRIIDEYRMRDRMIISSFNHYSVMRMKELAPDMKYGLLESSWILDFASYAKKCGVDYIHPLFCSITDELVSDCCAQGIGINTWTVNEPDHIRAVAAKGVAAIIGNFPDRVKEILG